jgi:tetratricopeptide (TPR) repeat protein
MNLGRWEDAIAAYTQTLAVEPAYSQAYVIHKDMASAILRSRGPAEALEELKRSIELNARYAPAHSETAAAYHSLGRYEEAVESLKKAVAIQPGAPAFHNNLGDLYQHLGKIPEAEKELRESVSIGGDAPQGLIELAALLFSQNKIDEADGLTQSLPKNNNGYVLIANTLQHQGKRAEAEAALRKALQQDPNNALALNNLGYQMIEHDEKIEEALAMIQRAVKTEPKNPSYLDSLGWAYFKLEKFEEAERYLTEAAQFGTSSVILDHLGDAFLKRGKKDQARDVWQKALALRIPGELAARIREKLNAASK